jgi:hypothetical protein
MVIIRLLTKTKGEILNQTIQQLEREAIEGTLECPKCDESICYEYEQHSIHDIDCEDCALFQPADIYYEGSCFSFSLD